MENMESTGASSLMAEPKIDLDTLRRRLATLRADLQGALQLEHGAGERAREALIRGDEEADGVVTEHTAAKEKVALVRAAIGELERLIPRIAEAEALAAARKRMTGLHRALGSLTAETDKDVGRIVEAAAALVEAVQRLEFRYGDRCTLWSEVLVLHERFGLAMPEGLAPPLRPEAIAAVIQALARVRAVRPAPHPTPPKDLGAEPHRGGAWSVRTVMDRIAGTPAAELLAKAGPGILGDPGAWEARRRQEHDAGRDAADAARAAELRRHDDWLRAQLAEGPVALAEMKKSAEAAGLRFERDQNHHGASVREAADRLGLLGLEEHGGGPVWWGLRSTWDRQRFRELQQPSRSTLAGWR